MSEPSHPTRQWRVPAQGFDVGEALIEIDARGVRLLEARGLGAPQLTEVSLDAFLRGALDARLLRRGGLHLLDEIRLAAAARRSPEREEAPPPEEPDLHGASYVLLASYGDQKIWTIKRLRELTKMGLREAKDLVERAPALIGPLEPAAAAELHHGLLMGGLSSVSLLTAWEAEREARYTLRLRAIGDHKIRVIKVFRDEVPRLDRGLKAAKEAVEASSPHTDALTAKEAERVAALLREAGAEVYLEEA